jgi:hypothetical protein
VKQHEETQEKPPQALELEIEPLKVDLTTKLIPIEPATTAAQPTEFSKLNVRVRMLLFYFSIGILLNTSVAVVAHAN